MKAMYTFLFVLIAFMFFCISDLQAQMDDNEGPPNPVPEEKVKKEKPKRQARGVRARGDSKSRLIQRLKRVSPELAKTAGDLGDCDQKLLTKLVKGIVSQTRHLLELKKSNEEAYTRKVNLMTLKLEALPLIESYKNGADEQQKEEAKTKLLENLSKAFDLEKEELEEQLKEIQKKLEMYNSKKDEVLNQQIENLTKVEEQPQPKQKKHSPKKMKKEAPAEGDERAEAENLPL